MDEDARRGGNPEAMAEVLKRVMRQPVFSVRRRRSRIAIIWEAAAGPELAAETRPAAIRKIFGEKRMLLRTTSPTWRTI